MQRILGLSVAVGGASYSSISARRVRQPKNPLHYAKTEVLVKLFCKVVSQLLVVCMILLPYSAHAGVIGTDQAIASAQDLANRDKVTAFMNRGEVVKRLEALGINAATARERVNALTQEEINRIAGKINTAPAGAMVDWWIGAAVVLIALILWWAYMNPGPLPPGEKESSTTDRQPLLRHVIDVHLR